MPKSKTVSVSMTPEAYEKLTKLAKETNRTMSGQINWFLKQIFDGMERNPHYLENPLDWKLIC